MRLITKTILMVLVLVLVFVWVEIARSPQGEGWASVYFFDVGQGDAALIQRGSYQILIDGGPDDKILSELGRVMPLTDRNIEVIILSHPHADHLTGLNQVVERYQVGTIYSSGVAHTSDGYLEFLEKVKQKKIPLEIPEIDKSITPYENARLEFLWPGNQYNEKKIDNLNNSSLVNSYCYFERCILFTGDIETDEQAKMFEYYQQAGKDLSVAFLAPILKVAHHGSSNGSNDRFYDLVGPAYSILEVGVDNKYGHPHQSTVDLIGKYQSKLLRTDRDGTIQFVLEKEGVMAQNNQ